MNDTPGNQAPGLQTPGLQSPGELLSGRRQQQGRSLEDLAEATKIPLPMLHAIERDEYHRISGELYVKSFLRAYAGEVGVETEDILQRYASYTGEAPSPQGVEGQPGVWREDEVQVKRLGLPWKTIGIAAACVILVFLGGYFLLRGDDQTSPEESRRNGDEEEAVVPASTALNDSEQPGPMRESLLASGPLASRQDGGTVAEDQPNLAVREGTPTGESSPVAEPALNGALVSAPEGAPDRTQLDGRQWPVILRLLLPEKRNLMVKKDGDRQFASVDWKLTALTKSMQLKSGTGYRVSEGVVVYWGAEDHFSIKMDDSSGVRATINGQYRDLDGLVAGQEIILNDPDVIRSNLPAVRP